MYNSGVARILGWGGGAGQNQNNLATDTMIAKLVLKNVQELKALTYSQF